MMEAVDSPPLSLSLLYLVQDARTPAGLQSEYERLQSGVSRSVWRRRA